MITAINLIALICHLNASTIKEHNQTLTIPYQCLQTLNQGPLNNKHHAIIIQTNQPTLSQYNTLAN